jgi:hypothetical protein
MRNPLLFSSELLVKKAAAQPQALSIPQYQAPTPAMNETQIQDMLTNIQSYPQEQQERILKSINQNENLALGNGFFSNITRALDAPSKRFNEMQGSINNITNSLFGWTPFDAQDYNRSQAQKIMREAAKNPLLYRKVTQDLQRSGAIPKPQQSAGAGMPAKTVINSGEFAGTPPAAMPTATPVTQPTTQQTAGNATAIANKFLANGYAPNATTPPLPVAQAPTTTTQAAQPAAAAAPAPIPSPAAAPTPGAPAVAKAPIPTQAQAPAPAAPSATETNLVSAAKPQTVTPTPQRKEGLIEGIPASQWIAQNKARQQASATAYKANTPTAPATSGMQYNATTGQYQRPGYNMYAGRVI